MKHGIQRVFALTLALLLALAVTGAQGISEGYASRHAGNEVSGAAAALAADRFVPQVLDIATGKMTALTVDEGEVMPWDEFFHK